MSRGFRNNLYRSKIEIEIIDVVRSRETDLKEKIDIVINIDSLTIFAKHFFPIKRKCDTREIKFVLYILINIFIKIKLFNFRLNTVNEGRAAIGDMSGFLPCTPNGCIELIKKYSYFTRYIDIYTQFLFSIIIY